MGFEYATHARSFIKGEDIERREDKLDHGPESGMMIPSYSRATRSFGLVRKEIQDKNQRSVCLPSYRNA
jgi:hypothetical protein